MRTVRYIGAIACAMALAGSAQASVTIVRNSCAAPNTVEVVTLSLNTYEYTFRRFPNGPVYIFPGITNPNSTNQTRAFAVPYGTYRLTYRLPSSTPVGVYGPNVVLRPHQMIGGTCVAVDPRSGRSLTAPVQ